MNMGGLQTDVDFNVMDTEDEVIEGRTLWATPKAALLVDTPAGSGISHAWR
ncbi:MAG: hypothetical protein ACLSVD_05170 [Eggerthellaceae bacterium]